MHTGRLDKGELVVDGSAVEDGPVKVDDVDDRVDFFSIHSWAEPRLLEWQKIKRKVLLFLVPYVG